jgi:hypothetical protein
MLNRLIIQRTYGTMLYISILEMLQFQISYLFMSHIYLLRHISAIHCHHQLHIIFAKTLSLYVLFLRITINTALSLIYTLSNLPLHTH